MWDTTRYTSLPLCSWTFFLLALVWALPTKGFLANHVFIFYYFCAGEGGDITSWCNTEIQLNELLRLPFCPFFRNFRSALRKKTFLCFKMFLAECLKKKPGAICRNASILVCGFPMHRMCKRRLKKEETVRPKKSRAKSTSALQKKWTNEIVPCLYDKWGMTVFIQSNGGLERF